MNIGGKHFLTGAAFARNQNGGLTTGNRAACLKNIFYDRAICEKRFIVAKRGFILL